MPAKERAEILAALTDVDAVVIFSEPDVRETKASLKTTELWLTLAGIAALIVAYNVADDDSLGLWRTALLCTALGAAYIVSRGFAKSGSRPESSHWDGGAPR